MGNLSLIQGSSLHSPLGSAHMSWPCHFLLVTATLQGSEQTGRNGPPTSLGFPGGSAGKESTCNLGDLGSIPGLGRSPGEGKGFPLQYSGLENPVDCIVHRVAKSRTQLSDFHVHVFLAEAADEAYRVTCSGHLSPKKQKKEWNLN